MKRAMLGFTLIELMIVVVIIGVLAAIAIPGFLKFRSRSQQSEARSNSKAMFTAEKAFFAAKDRYSNLLSDVGFQPERNNRYNYFLDAATVVQDSRAGATASTPTTATSIQADVYKGFTAVATAPANTCGQGIIGIATAGVWTGGATGNIDGDTTNDEWVISTKGFASSGCDDNGNKSAGEPVNQLNDVTK